MVKVITTVGTSLFTNYLRIDNSIRNNFESIEDKKYVDRKVYNDEVESIKKKFISLEKNLNLSAEVKTLLKLKEELKDELDVYLFTTDSITSKLAADIIKEKFTDEFSFKETKIIEGLQTKDFDEYDSIGFLRLITAFKQIVDKSRDEKTELYLAISGGYKAIIPPLTILGQIYDVQLVYIYEESDELIYFPSLPVHFDWSLAEQFYPFLQEIAQGKIIHKNDSIVEMEEMKLIREINSKYKITPLGNIFKEYIEAEMPLADNTLGFFVEYKLMEYYMKNHYKNQFSSVSHSERIESNGNRREIDLILRNLSNNEIVIVESKSFLQVYREKDFEKLKEQISGQINILFNGNYNPTDYILIVHHTHFLKYDMLQNKLSEIKKIINIVHSRINFRAFSLKINLNLRDRSYYKNPYQKFLSNPIELKEIKLN